MKWQRNGNSRCWHRRQSELHTHTMTRKCLCERLSSYRLDCMRKWQLNEANVIVDGLFSILWISLTFSSRFFFQWIVSFVPIRDEIMNEERKKEHLNMKNVFISSLRETKKIEFFNHDLFIDESETLTVSVEKSVDIWHTCNEDSKTERKTIIFLFKCDLTWKTVANRTNLRSETNELLQTSCVRHDFLEFRKTKRQKSKTKNKTHSICSHIFRHKNCTQTANTSMSTVNRRHWRSCDVIFFAPKQKQTKKKRKMQTFDWRNATIATRNVHEKHANYQPKCVINIEFLCRFRNSSQFSSSTLFISNTFYSFCFCCRCLTRKLFPIASIVSHCFYFVI